MTLNNFFKVFTEFGMNETKSMKCFCYKLSEVPMNPSKTWNGNATDMDLLSYRNICARRRIVLLIRLYSWAKYLAKVLKYCLALKPLRLNQADNFSTFMS